MAVISVSASGLDDPSFLIIEVRGFGNGYVCR